MVLWLLRKARHGPFAYLIHHGTPDGHVVAWARTNDPVLYNNNNNNNNNRLQHCLYHPFSFALQTQQT